MVWCETKLVVVNTVEIPLDMSPAVDFVCMPVGVVGLQPRQAEAEAARNYLGLFHIVLHEVAACRRTSSASILSV